MSIAEKVRREIKRMPPGTVFLVSDLSTYKQEKKATQNAIYFYLDKQDDRKNDNLRRLAEGLYYKEEVGILGALPPSYDAVLHALIVSNNKRVGFVTGQQLFNKRGLSTQVPATTTVVTSKFAPKSVDVDGIKIKVERKSERIKEKDIKRFEFEYILNNLTKIQSLEANQLLDSLSTYIELFYSDKKQFLKLYEHLRYKKTKAFLGALLEDYQEQSQHSFEYFLRVIKKDLSQRSEYKLGYIANFINHTKEWNIKR